MTSGAGRTAHLVVLSSATEAVAADERLRFAPSAQLSEFARAAAQVGLDVPLAARLALERALVLLDAQALALDVQRARATLSRAAGRARATLPLSAHQSDYVRELYDETPLTRTRVEHGLAVSVPQDVLARARDTVTQSALRADVVSEMLAWERAARLQARTMCEWGLKTLAELLAMR